MSEELKQIYTQINAKGLSLFPLARLNAVSVYTADFYENYDYDIVLPGQRDKLVKLLKQFGFKQVSGRVITTSDRRITFEFARPNFTLGDDPAEKTRRLINKSKSLIVITPTQSMLIYLKQYYDQIKRELNQDDDRPLINELTALLYEQPANLDKVREWLSPSKKDDVFVLLKQQFREAQQKGIEDRQQHKFESRIATQIDSL